MDYSQIVNSFSKATVLVIGDVMLDSYIIGDVARISPEAPVPIVHVTKREYKLGGAANVAKNLQALGCKALLCSIIGKDDSAAILLKKMEESSLSNTYFLMSDSRITTNKIRILGGSHQMLRVDDEQTLYITKSEEDIIKQNIDFAFSNNSISAVILQDYNKGFLSKEIITHSIQIANKHSIPVMVDPKKTNFFEYKHVCLFKPNFKEFTEGIGKHLSKTDLPTLFTHAQEFLLKQNIENIMITLSEHGVFIANTKEFHHIPTRVRNVADVSGAGDTVISTATACITAGLQMNEVAHIANIAAGIVCEKSGVETVSKQELIQYL